MSPCHALPKEIRRGRIYRVICAPWFYKVLYLIELPGLPRRLDYEVIGGPEHGVIGRVTLIEFSRRVRA